MHRKKNVFVPAFVELLLVALSAAPAAAQEVTTRTLTAPEKELVQLCRDLQEAFDQFHARSESFMDSGERARFEAANDPSAEFIPRLVDFERRHRGTHAGLMAARRLVHLGAGGGELENPRDVGRRHALSVLEEYAAAPELPEILRYLDVGNVEPQVPVALQALIDSPQATAVNRAFARYTLAEWNLVIRDARVRWEQRAHELDTGSPLQFPQEKAYLAGTLAKMPAAAELARGAQEALQLLESLAEADPEFRQPGVLGVDERWYVIDVDREKTRSMPLLRELAAGLLFKERYLRVGHHAPELSLQLVSGKPWSLAQQRGRVVIIQFSFKGCGPCEAMYPDLTQLSEKYGERLVVLSIMADEKLDDTLAAVSSGKVSWNVSWDGFRGPIATKWSVGSFPTVYVIGPEGTVAARNLRGEALKKRVGELLSSN